MKTSYIMQPTTRIYIQEMIMSAMHKDWINVDDDIKKRTTETRIMSLYERLTPVNKTIVNSLFIELTGKSMQYFVNNADKLREAQTNVNR